MKMPPEFYQMCTFIGVDREEFNLPVNAQISKVLSYLNAADKIVIKKYLDHLLAENHDDKFFKALWESTAPRVAFEFDGKTRPLFTLMRDIVTAELKS